MVETLSQKATVRRTVSQISDAKFVCSGEMVSLQCLEARCTLRYVEPLSDVRTTLEGFCGILTELAMH